MSTTQPDPLSLQDGNLDAEKDQFCCGDPIWPQSGSPFRAEFSLSCGWVIVDPDGRESTLGYANERHARDVAEMMTYAYRRGKSDASAALRIPGDCAAATIETLRSEVNAWRSWRKLVVRYMTAEVPDPSAKIEALKSAMSATDAAGALGKEASDGK